MARDVRSLIEDIQYCIREIEMNTGGLSFETYCVVSQIHHATERNFTVIGEAIKRLHYVSEEVSDRIDNAIAITGFRNLVVHEYENVDHKEVWKIIQESMPKLKDQINTWAAELGMRRWE